MADEESREVDAGVLLSGGESGNYRTRRKERMGHITCIPVRNKLSELVLFIQESTILY